MKTISAFAACAFILFFTSCERSETDDKIISLEKEIISGYIQKGPYINGTSIAVSELDGKLNPTGKVFNTQISDNKGSFELRNIMLNSNFVEIIANGYYFNENTGKISSSQLTLHGLTDLADSSYANVNILTELEKNRVVNLVSEGLPFKSAKIQAQKELLDLFQIVKTDIKTSEYLDIMKEGEDNTILLAVSLIMQGMRTEAELSELIAEISTDMKSDGILNNQALGAKLINDIRLINLPEVRNYIAQRYSELNTEIDVPDFEKYVDGFINNTNFEITNNISYPEEGEAGPNILSNDRLTYPSRSVDGFLCSVVANLPKGTSLKIVIRPDLEVIDSSLYNPEKEIIPESYSDYGVFTSPASGWLAKTDNSYYTHRIMTLYNTSNESTIDARFDLNRHGSASIEIYENNQEIPVRIKKIKW